MRREKKEKEKARIKEELKGIRYIKIINDCYISINNSTVPLKKGDIVRINNNQIEDLVFNKDGGILSSLGYRGNVKKSSFLKSEDPCTGYKLEKYPYDRPLNIEEYIKMQPKFELKSPISISLWISNEWVYLTHDFLDKMNNDDSIIDCQFGKPFVKVSEYNKGWIKQASKKGIEIIKAEIGENLLPIFEKNSNDDNKKEKNKKIDTIYVPQTMDEFKPGLYKIKTKKFLIPLEIFLKSGETIDFSRLEFALLLLNQDFMEVLANSREITSFREKERIYKSEQKGFFDKSNIKYYRIKKDINLKKEEVEFLAREVIERWENVHVGHGYNNDRVWGDITPVETINGRVTIIKVEFTNEAIISIMDREIRKIARKMNQKESFQASIYEQKKSQRALEEKIELNKQEKVNYFRIKMIVDLAKFYTLEEKYKECGFDKDSFQDYAIDYYDENKKKYNKICDLFDDGISIEEFYMMHLIKEKFKDDRIIAEEHQSKIKEKQASFISILKGKSQKEFER